jgi:long-chain fatty acid transport protein
MATSQVFRQIITKGINMNHVQNVVRGVAVVAGLVVLTTSSVFALGFRNPDQGAAATGQGEAFIVQADDASAAYYNPAGMTQIKGTELCLGSYVFVPKYEFSGAAGTDKMDSISISPHLYWVSDFYTERLRVGLALNIPYGTSVKWSDNGPFQYLVTESRLTIYNIEPSVSYQVTDDLSVGVGLNVYHGDVKQEFNYSPFLPGVSTRFQGQNQGVGGTVGLLWKPSEKHGFAAVYRSPFRVNFEGDATITGLVGPSASSAMIEFPQTVTIGYAFRPTPKLKLEVNVDWTDWDTLNTVQLRSVSPLVAGDPRSTIPFNWESSFFYEVGAQYELNESWVLRAGYIFSENSVPNSSFSPLVPDSNRHVLSVGASYSHGRFGLSFGYQLTFSEDRTIPPLSSASSPFVDGEWEAMSHGLIFTGSMKF